MKLRLLHTIIFLFVIAHTMYAADLKSAAATDGLPLVITNEDHYPVSPTQDPTPAPHPLKIQQQTVDAAGNASNTTLTPRSHRRVLSLLSQASRSTTTATDTSDNNPTVAQQEEQKKRISAADLCASGKTASSTSSACTHNGIVEDGRLYLARVAAEREKTDAAAADGDSPTVATPVDGTVASGDHMDTKHSAQTARLKQAQALNTVLTPATFAAAAAQNEHALKAAATTATLKEALTEVDLKAEAATIQFDRSSLKSPLALQAPAPVSIPPSRSGTLRVEICGYTDEEFEDCDPLAVHTPRFTQGLKEYQKRKTAQAKIKSRNAPANPTCSQAVVAVAQLMRATTLETLFPQADAGSDSSASTATTSSSSSTHADTLGSSATAPTNGSAPVVPAPAPLVIPQPQMPSAASAPAVVVRRPITPPADTLWGSAVRFFRNITS
jgi:hypothetical protein